MSLEKYISQTEESEREINNGLDALIITLMNLVKKGVITMKEFYSRIKAYVSREVEEEESEDYWDNEIEESDGEYSFNDEYSETSGDNSYSSGRFSDSEPEERGYRGGDRGGAKDGRGRKSGGAKYRRPKSSNRGKNRGSGEGVGKGGRESGPGNKSGPNPDCN